MEGTTWYHLVELVINPSTTAFMTTFVETVTWNNQTYAPVPMSISPEQQGAEGELPSVYIDVANYGGQAFRFARDNDLTLNDVTIRLVNATATSSGDDSRLKMQILGATFTKDVARFNLSLNFTYDAEGPKRIFDRRSFPIPFAQGSWVIL